MNRLLYFEIKTLSSSLPGDKKAYVTCIGWAERKPRFHEGRDPWYSVTYRGKRYRVEGMGRGDAFIRIDRPLGGRER